MKNISSDLSTHLDNEVTTIATCWKIVRRDGREFFFTDHDQDLLVDGDIYEAESSYTRTAMANASDLSVANLDVAGMIDSSVISDHDLRNGLFNRADVYIFIVNWAAPEQGILKVRRGWFGEVTINSNRTFQTEIRGLAQALGHNFIELFSPECRADFCDSRCKLNIADFQQQVLVVSASARDTLVIGSALDAPGGHLPETPDRTFRYYKLDLLTSKSTDGQVGFAEVELRTTPGGPKLAVAHASANNTNSYHGYTLSPDKAIDGNTETLWTADEGWSGKASFTLDMGVPVAVSEISITSRADGLWLGAPTTFTLYTSNDGTTWTIARAFTFPEWTSARQTQRVYFDQFTHDPVDNMAYGTVEFIEGPNAGRIVEIIGYNNATGQIDLFEPVAYEITPGTVVKIAPGCDKSLERCKDYGNVINRRAEDFIPGNDEMMRYPDAPDY